MKKAIYYKGEDFGVTFEIKDVPDDYKDKLPNLSYNLFTKSGHFPFLEEQELFDTKLIEWIHNQ